MKNLTPSQLKSLSEFFNTIAAAWFSAGIISPLFIKPESIVRALLLGAISVILSLSILIWALYIVRRVKQ